MTILIFIIAYFTLDAIFVSMHNWGIEAEKRRRKRERSQARMHSGQYNEQRRQQLQIDRNIAAAQKEAERIRAAEIRRQLDESELQRLHQVQAGYFTILRLTEEQLHGNISESKRIAIQKQLVSLNQKILAIDAKKQKLELKYQS